MLAIIHISTGARAGCWAAAWSVSGKKGPWTSVDKLRVGGVGRAGVPSQGHGCAWVAGWGHDQPSAAPDREAGWEKTGCLQCVCAPEVEQLNQGRTRKKGSLEEDRNPSDDQVRGVLLVQDLHPPTNRIKGEFDLCMPAGLEGLSLVTVGGRPGPSQQALPPVYLTGCCCCCC